MQKRKKKKPIKYRSLFILLSCILIGISIFFLAKLFKMDILGAKYMALICAIVALVELFIVLILNSRFKVAIKVPFVILDVLISGAMIFGIYNLDLASSFVSKIVNVVKKEEIYNVYALVDSDFASIADLNGADLGIYDNGSETLEEALRLLKREVTFKTENTYDDLANILNECLDGSVDAIFISSSMSELLNEEYPEQMSKLKIVGQIIVSFEEDVKRSDIDVTEEPFLIYVSGIDTYGSIGTVSRSDVNILIAINPKTNQILLVNTPRDYYVKLHSKKAYDKLTHAGIYGIEESMNTLADLYATDIDFYLKINFSSLIKIVDALGGITVESKYSFSYDGYTFYKGQNTLDGAGALAFSRCRKELPLGDISRGENQEAVIKAIIKKATSPSIISKYSSILKTMEASFVTNMSEENIYSLIKYQINENPTWDISTQNATGSDAYKTTYSAGKTKLYVMTPNEESVTDIKNALREILEN